MTVLVSEQDSCMVCAKRIIGRNHFGCTRWHSMSTRLKWKLISVHLVIVLILTQDRCMVCTEYTIGSEIVLDTPNETSRLRGSCGILFWSDWIRS
jgi:hypothetical protein